MIEEVIYAFDNGYETELRFGLRPDKHGVIRVRKKGILNYLKTFFKGVSAYEEMHNIPLHLMNAETNLVHGSKQSNKKVIKINMSLRTLEEGHPNLSPRQLEEIYNAKHQAITMSRVNNQLREIIKTRTVKDFLKDEMQRDARHIGETKNLATTGQKQYVSMFNPATRRMFGRSNMGSMPSMGSEGD